MSKASFQSRCLVVMMMMCLVQPSHAVRRQDPLAAADGSSDGSQQRPEMPQDGVQVAKNLGTDLIEDSAKQEPQAPGVQRLVPEIQGSAQTEGSDLSAAADYLRSVVDGRDTAADNIRVHRGGEKVTITIHEPRDPYARHSSHSDASHQMTYPTDRAGPGFDRAASAIRHQNGKGYDQSSTQAGDLTDQLHRQAGVVSGATDDLARDQERLRDLHGSARDLDQQYRTQHNEMVNLTRSLNARSHDEANAGRKREQLRSQLEATGEQYRNADDAYNRKMTERQAMEEARMHNLEADSVLGRGRKEAIEQWKSESDNVRLRDRELQQNIKKLDDLNSHLRHVERGFLSSTVPLRSSHGVLFAAVLLMLVL